MQPLHSSSTVGKFMVVGRCECGFDAKWQFDPRARWPRAHALHHARWREGVRIRGDRVDLALERAARIYQLECALDFSPADWSGARRIRVLEGRLVGFAMAVLNDEPYLEHVWTCAARRKQGVATQLVRELVEELGLSLLVYHVATAAGEAWCRSAERAGLIRRPRLAS